MLILDAGAFLAAERGDRDLIALTKAERLQGRSPVTCASVVAQVWRGGAGRQARLAQLLELVEIKALDAARSKRIGVLLAASGSTDIVDASIVCLAHDGDSILTSDTSDLLPLAEAADLHIELIPC